MEKTAQAAGNPAAEAAVEHMAANCPSFARAINILGRRWMGLVIRALMPGPRRFNELLTAIPGISDPLLTQRLRELEAAGLVERRVLPTSPVRVEYTLTEAGCDLEQVMLTISRWAHRWLGDDTLPVCSTLPDAAETEA